MKKAILSLALACLASHSIHAQLNGDGYYRIQNVRTSRYMSLSDDKSAGANFSSMVVDAGALVTKKSVDEVLTDPGTIFYIQKVNANEYNISAQGANLYNMIKYYIRITALNDGTYRAWQSDSGQTIFLCDRVKDGNYDLAQSYVDTKTTDTQKWYIKPVNQIDNYIGVKPMFQQGGKYYTTFYADYPFTFASSGMRALYVNKILGNGKATYKVIDGTVPAKTPVIIECSSDDPAQNKLQIAATSPTAVSDNLLKGVYFGMGHIASDHFNSLTFDANTMRVLGLTADGSLALNNADTYMADVLHKVEVGYDDYEYPSIKAIPHNTAYVMVDGTVPTELKLYVEGDPATSIIEVNADNNYTDAAPVYSLSGMTVRNAATSTDGLPQGVYIFKGKKVVVK